jgi:glycosyltransferase involved in cell wall biosynthesis
MKIAVLAPIAWRTPPRKYGPWEQVASNLTEGLHEKGIDVTLFATKDSLTQAKLDGPCVLPYAEDSHSDPKVAECLHISYLMERANEFDLIHNHFDFLPLTYASLVKTPMVTTIHGFSSPKILPVYQRFNAQNSYVSISYADRHPSLDYTDTVYNGIIGADFPFEAEPDDYLLFFGRIHPEKGTREAIEIARKAKKRLLIAGLIQDQAYFEVSVKPFLDNSAVMYLGNVGPDHRKSLLGKAQALLHPILFNEPFGLSVAEAMHCGTPVVAFHRGSMNELIRERKSGFLVHSVTEGAAAVENIGQISRQECHRWASDMFSSEKMVSNYLKVYEKVLDTRRLRR